jgi:ADP-dependent phosphofructokinase/glucokinase
MKIHCSILGDDTLQIGREVAILNKHAFSLQRDERYVFTTPHSIVSHKKHDLSIHCNYNLKSHIQNSQQSSSENFTSDFLLRIVIHSILSLLLMHKNNHALSEQSPSASITISSIHAGTNASLCCVLKCHEFKLILFRN